jgi:hypothetical protein
MLLVQINKQGLIKENLFSLNLSNAVFRFTFTAVARIPFKANNVIKVNHGCMLQAYTEFVNLGFVSDELVS